MIRSRPVSFIVANIISFRWPGKFPRHYDNHWIFEFSPIPSSFRIRSIHRVFVALNLPRPWFHLRASISRSFLILFASIDAPNKPPAIQSIDVNACTRWKKERIGQDKPIAFFEYGRVKIETIPVDVAQPFAITFRSSDAKAYFARP